MEINTHFSFFCRVRHSQEAPLVRLFNVLSCIWSARDLLRLHHFVHQLLSLLLHPTHHPLTCVLRILLCSSHAFCLLKRRDGQTFFVSETQNKVDGRGGLTKRVVWWLLKMIRIRTASGGLLHISERPSCGNRYCLRDHCNAMYFRRQWQKLWSSKLPICASSLLSSVLTYAKAAIRLKTNLIYDLWSR